MVFARSAALLGCLASFAAASGDGWSCNAKCDQDADKICGGKNISAANGLGLSTCTETKTAIFDVAKYKTSAHMVPCDPDYCKMCSEVGEKTHMGSTVTCYNNSVSMYKTLKEANDAALARGCKGSHMMKNMHMSGETHASCQAGKNYFEEDVSGTIARGAAFTLVATLVGASLSLVFVDQVGAF
eukprot:TRINITY_DN12231_c0_g1_i4.p1 TRINITY_DN12231_c0_g1~~TRINITY_DN12231_c0_g1_i4.p1  ORF type:complete len:209 (+),score=42.59 TRINITY_DN12231_c0_g1_i4:75-629(+)